MRVIYAYTINIRAFRDYLTSFHTSRAGCGHQNPGSSEAVTVEEGRNGPLGRDVTSLKEHGYYCALTQRCKGAGDHIH